MVSSVVEGEVLAGDRPIAEGTSDGAGLFSHGWRLWALRLVLLVAILAIWQLVSGNPKREFALIDSFWIGKPSDILGRLVEWTVDGTLWFHMFITLREALIGFVIGGIVGVAVGFALARN